MSYCAAFVVEGHFAVGYRGKEMYAPISLSIFRESVKKWKPVHSGLK